ncbi:FkbM family methyltransferase [Synechococcus sp. MIT S1220]|uniref:FkbM family methyltransferase n=1 Tax=Synechococcus sp. MIT S1220 TaxID=3082549 RepID=UPI0039AFA3A5
MHFFIQKSTVEKAGEEALSNLSLLFQHHFKEHKPRVSSVEDLQSWLRQWISAQLTDRSDLQVIKELRLIGHMLRMACHPIDLNLALTQVLLGLQSSAVTADCSGEENCLRTTLDYLNKSCKQLVLFDVGANQGQWSTMAAQHHSQIDLHLFEPNYKLESKLKNNATQFMNNADSRSNCVINMMGISSRKQAELFVSNQSSEMATTNRDSGLLYGDHEHFEIKTSRGDDYCQSNHISKIDYLKLDTEGTEFESLESFGTILKEDKISFIQFEYGKPNYYTRSGLHQYFSCLDEHYTLHKILPEGITNALEYSSNIEDFQWANYLAVHRRQNEYFKCFKER